MKKTLIASAIAAATLSSAAFAEGPTVYGNIQLAYKHLNCESDTAVCLAQDGVTLVKEQTENDFIDNGSTLGVKGEHEIAPGISGFFKAEFEFSADQKDDVAGNQLDNVGNRLDEAYIGVKGGFGSVLVGSEDTVYEWTDMIDYTEASSFAGEIAKDREGDQLQYVSPTIAGGLSVGVSLPLTNDTYYSGQVAGMYSTNMFDVALAYSIGKEQADTGTAYGDSVGLAAKVKLNQLALIGQYETRSADETLVGGVEDPTTELDLWALSAVYSLGKTQLAVGYKATSDGAAVSTDDDLVFLQALHNLSDSMYVYVEFGTGSTDVGSTSIDHDELYLGAAYNF